MNRTKKKWGLYASLQEATNRAIYVRWREKAYKAAGINRRGYVRKFVDETNYKKFVQLYNDFCDLKRLYRIMINSTYGISCRKDMTPCCQQDSGYIAKLEQEILRIWVNV